MGAWSAIPNLLVRVPTTGESGRGYLVLEITSVPVNRLTKQNWHSLAKYSTYVIKHGTNIMGTPEPVSKYTMKHTEITLHM